MAIFGFFSGAAGAPYGGCAFTRGGESAKNAAVVSPTAARSVLRRREDLTRRTAGSRETTASSMATVAHDSRVLCPRQSASETEESSLVHPVTRASGHFRASPTTNEGAMSVYASGWLGRRERHVMSRRAGPSSPARCLVRGRRTRPSGHGVAPRASRPGATTEAAGRGSAAAG